MNDEGRDIAQEKVKAYKSAMKEPAVYLWAKAIGVGMLWFLVVGVVLALLLAALELPGTVEADGGYNGVGAFIAIAVGVWAAWRYRQRRLARRAAPRSSPETPLSPPPPHA